ncbi:UNVERIFIED_CONTAM: hypothetical protein GTU68_023116 [Idotea baltica]|nr:hypothetical protein [Idotea baltica]
MKCINVVARSSLTAYCIHQCGIQQTMAICHTRFPMMVIHVMFLSLLVSHSCQDALYVLVPLAFYLWKMRQAVMKKFSPFQILKLILLIKIFIRTKTYQNCFLIKFSISLSITKTLKKVNGQRSLAGKVQRPPNGLSWKP